MDFAFCAYKMKVDAHVFWVAKSMELKGCVGQGDSLYEAIAELENNEKEWISAAEAYDIMPCVSKLPEEGRHDADGNLILPDYYEYV